MRKATPVALLAVAVTLTGCSGSPFASYADSAVLCAQEGHNAVGTLRVIVGSHDRGRLLPASTEAAVHDVVATATSALDQFDGTEPVSPDDRRLHDELHPLLHDAVARIAEVQEALDTGDTARAAVLDEPLRRVDDRLVAFAEDHR